MPNLITNIHQIIKEQKVLAANAFVYLALSVLIFYYDVNHSLFTDINYTSQYLPSTLLALITVMGDSLMIVAFLTLFALKERMVIVIAVLTSIIGGVFIRVAKTYFDIDRPPLTLGVEQVNIVGPTLTLTSFPSGHTFSALAGAAVIAYFVESDIKRFLILLLAFVIGLSRILVGAHWPLDVLVGGLCGMLVSCFAILCVKNYPLLHSKPVFIVSCVILLLANASLFLHDTGYANTLLFTRCISFASVGVAIYLIATSFLRLRKP